MSLVPNIFRIVFVTIMLTRFLIYLFVPDYKRPDLQEVRLSYGMLAGFVGIAVNIILFCIKFSIGLISGSVAIAADAVNNLSDAGSAIVTVVGFKLSSLPVDNGHPFGHGRMEYVAGVIVAIIIIAVGLDFFKESILRIISPRIVTVDGIALGIIGGTMLLKIWLLFFYRTVGRTIDSKVISAAAFDSLSDLLCTSAVLAAVFFSRFTAFPVDGIAGLAVAAVILIGGVKILRGTINPLVGECPSPMLVEELKENLLSCDGIKGVHDIIIHNYGPNQYFATAHAEVEPHGTLLSVHDMLEAAEEKVASRMPVRLLLHCDPCNLTDPHVNEWRKRLEVAVAEIDGQFKLYDFRLDESGEVRRLHCHLLTPRNYRLSNDEIYTKINDAMRRYDQSVEVKIDFLNTYV